MVKPDTCTRPHKGGCSRWLDATYSRDTWLVGKQHAMSFAGLCFLRSDEIVNASLVCFIQPEKSPAKVLLGF